MRWREAKKADLGRRAPNATLGQALVQDSSGSNSLSKLSRYETAIQWSFHRLVHELRELQDIRKHVQAEKSSTIDVLEDQP